MFARLFNRRVKQSPPVYHPGIKKQSTTHVERVESIMVMDNAGFLLGSFTSESKINQETDNALISMFISAISNFSKELFKRNDGASIMINRGEYLISLESNNRICVAFIGQYDPNRLYKKLGVLLREIEKLYAQVDEPNKLDCEEAIVDLIKKSFL